MIERLKKWIEIIKSSSIARPFIEIKRWFQDNVIKRKLVIFSVLFTAWISLLLGAIYSPQRQTYTDEQLKTVTELLKKRLDVSNVTVIQQVEKQKDTTSKAESTDKKKKN